VLVRSGGGEVGEFFVFANDGDQCLGGARQAAVAAIDEAKFAPEIDAFDVEQLHFASLHLVARKTFANEGDTGISADESLDHADAGKLHHDAQAGTIGTKQLVQDLSCETSARKNQGLPGDFLDELLSEPFRDRARERLTRGWEAAIGQPRYGPNGASVGALIERLAGLDPAGVKALAASARKAGLDDSDARAALVFGCAADVFAG